MQPITISVQNPMSGGPRINAAKRLIVFTSYLLSGLDYLLARVASNQNGEFAVGQSTLRRRAVLTVDPSSIVIGSLFRV
ncbi:MAG: hypothetical protein WA061_06190 [Microgenomates group bacterium]